MKSYVVLRLVSRSLTIVGASGKADTLTVDFGYKLLSAVPAGTLPGGVVFDCSGGGTTTTNASGNTTTSEVRSLRIQGTGAWHPTAALLLNYKLPINRLMGERFSWGLCPA